jgi:hypothetical protein
MKDYKAIDWNKKTAPFLEAVFKSGRVKEVCFTTTYP